MAKNKLNYWRHQLQINTQKEFAEWLGVTHAQLNIWERQVQQPNVDTLVRIWRRLREKYPDMDLQDLLDLD